MTRPTPDGAEVLTACWWLLLAVSLLISAAGCEKGAKTSGERKSPSGDGPIGAWYGDGEDFPDKRLCIILCPNGRFFAGDSRCDRTDRGDFRRFYRYERDGDRILTPGAKVTEWGFVVNGDEAMLSFKGKRSAYDDLRLSRVAATSHLCTSNEVEERDRRDRRGSRRRGREHPKGAGAAIIARCFGRQNLSGGRGIPLWERRNERVASGARCLGARVSSRQIKDFLGNTADTVSLVIAPAFASVGPLSPLLTGDPNSAMPPGLRVEFSSQVKSIELRDKGRRLDLRAVVPQDFGAR